MIKQLYSTLEEFKKPDFHIENKIYRKICDFNNEKFNNKSIPLDSEFFYEQIAFAFMEGKNPPSDWGETVYTPSFSHIDPISKKRITPYPDIKNITPEMINYWEKRSSEVDNPILQCRYAGLVWDFSQKIRKTKSDISVAHRLIDSIVKIANIGGDRLFNKLKRALKLAISLNNQQKIIFVRDTIIKHENTYSEDDKLGTWGYSYDLFIGDKDLHHKVQLEKEQEDKVIEELERKLNFFSNKNSNKFNPNSIEYVVTKLAPYYKNKNDIENTKRVLLIYKDSFLYGIKKNQVSLGSHWLEKIRKILFQYGLRKEAEKLEPDIRSLQKEDLKSLQKFETSIKIPKKDINAYISELDKRSLSKALEFIALYFIPDKKISKDNVLEIAKKNPLSFMIDSDIMDHKGIKIATIEPIDKDLDGHIIHQMSQSMSLNILFIYLGLNHLQKTKSLDTKSLSEHLFKSQVFTKDSHPIIKEGLKAYFEDNYIVSCSVLIHQIESAIRELVSIAGGTIYQPSSSFQERCFKLKPLGALLRDKVFIKVFEKLNSNIPDFFKIILVDPRSLNIRNSIYHGHFPANFLNKKIAIHIIHILLILSFLRKTEKSSQNK